MTQCLRCQRRVFDQITVIQVSEFIKLLLDPYAFAQNFNLSFFLAGYVFETLTVYSIIGNCLALSNIPSVQYTWFPGYAWQIATCRKCRHHVGWKFISKNVKMTPRSFYGLSGRNLTVKSQASASSASSSST